jgi:hypothetical protein
MGSFSGAVMAFDAPRTQAQLDDSRGDDAEAYPRDADDDGDAAEVICPRCDDTTVGGPCDGCGVPLGPLHDRVRGLWCHPTGEANQEREEA